jgi:hypothetical protein
MFEKLDWTSVVLIAISAVSGASGACLVIAHRIFRERYVSALLMFAYLIVGAILSISILCLLLIFEVQTSLAKVLLISISVGAIGSATLAVVNFGTRIALRYKNFEADIQFRKIKDETTDDDGNNRGG